MPLAVLVFAAERFGCSEEVLTIAAMMQVQHVFTLPSRAKAQAVSYLGVCLKTRRVSLFSLLPSHPPLLSLLIFPPSHFSLPHFPPLPLLLLLLPPSHRKLGEGCSVCMRETTSPC